MRSVCPRVSRACYELVGLVARLGSLRRINVHCDHDFRIGVVIQQRALGDDRRDMRVAVDLDAKIAGQRRFFECQKVVAAVVAAANTGLTV